MKKILVAILFSIGIFPSWVAADYDSDYDISKFQIEWIVNDSLIPESNEHLTEADRLKFQPTQPEPEYDYSVEIVVDDYKSLSYDDENYDAAKELLLGTFEHSKEKMKEAVIIKDDTVKYVIADKIKKSDFDAAKYLLEQESKKDSKDYYVKPTRYSAGDFDAAKYILNLN
ncbi:hypothetical protein [Endomicrobium proavitum]|uniref:Uncharacterized protein n=1 Tax=Endomicrobium proavitum TaxID=1408281 RepID=A0A0G3WHU8_9BACT|nr:hypothetical protein [Endomicrobium proavitum]AKL98251.1 exported protein of unknown function [Endomicrobium proavitum]